MKWKSKSKILLNNKSFRQSFDNHVWLLQNSETQICFYAVNVLTYNQTYTITYVITRNSIDYLQHQLTNRLSKLNNDFRAHFRPCNSKPFCFRLLEKILCQAPQIPAWTKTSTIFGKFAVFASRCQRREKDFTDLHGRDLWTYFRPLHR